MNLNLMPKAAEAEESGTEVPVVRGRKTEVKPIAQQASFPPAQAQTVAKAPERQSARALTRPEPM